MPLMLQDLIFRVEATASTPLTPSDNAQENVSLRKRKVGDDGGWKDPALQDKGRVGGREERMKTRRRNEMIYLHCTTSRDNSQHNVI